MSSSDITELLKRWGAGDREAEVELMMVYPIMREIAQRGMSH